MRQNNRKASRGDSKLMSKRNDIVEFCRNYNKDIELGVRNK